MVYAQQVYGYGKAGDVLIGLSTSGNSKNVVNAVKIAKAFNIRTISLTGEKESALSKLCDVTITVPATETFKIQEYHLPIYHAICAMIESSFFEE
jgi:D-sedoheptulose 7-phosphate isomerase